MSTKDRIFNFELQCASCYDKISFILKIIYPPSLAISGSTKKHNASRKHFFIKEAAQTLTQISFTPISDRLNKHWVPTYDR